MGRKGGPTIVFTLLLSIYTNITCIHTSMFSVQYGTGIFFLYFPYPNFEKNLAPHPLLL